VFYGRLSGGIALALVQQNLKCDTMRTLIDTPLFSLFASYLNGMKTATDNLASAYENFALLLAELPQDEDRMKQLRRLNYTRIELAFMQTASEKMTEGRHVLYDVFIGKTLALLDAEIEMVKDSFRHGGMMTAFRPEAVQGCGKKAAVTLTWNGTDSDLIELVAALMSAGAVGSAEGRKLTVVDVVRVFEDMFHLKINALYTKRGKVFDRCTDTTPFIDSLRKSYNQMLDKRLA